MNMVKLGSVYWKPSVVWLPLKARAAHTIKRMLRGLGLWRPDGIKPHRDSPGGAHSVSPASASAWDADASAEETAFIQAQIRDFRPDLVLATYAWMLPAVRARGNAHPPCAVLTLDVRHRQLVLEDGRLMERLNEHCSREREQRLLAEADALIAIQGMESKIFSTIFPEKPVVVARMAASPVSLPRAVGRTVLFVGSAHQANLQGLRWFITEAWPAVLREVPDALLLVAGGICDVLSTAEGPRVQLLGRMDSLRDAYGQARVVIAPILRGSGLKIKILEAVSFGSPVVTTSVGAEGYEDLRPELRVADDAASFAASTVQLLTDDRLEAGARAAMAQAASGPLSPASAYGAMVSLIHSLATRPDQPAPHPR